MMDSSIYTNSPGEDQVLRPFTRLMATAAHIRIAVPYFTRAQEILQAAERGAQIELLVCLNSATSPMALARVFEAKNVAIRYFTDDYHGKIFIMDGVAMLGSSNLTDGGLVSNREATILLDQAWDEDRILEVQRLFSSIWEGASVLTKQTLWQFKEAWEASSKLPSRDAPFQKLDAVVPQTVLAGSGKKTAQQHYRGELQKMIYEEYLPAFNEVQVILQSMGRRRPEFEGSMSWAPEVNRFLNWIRLVHAPGDAAWQDALQRARHEREPVIRGLAREWLTTQDPKIPDNYFTLLNKLQLVMGSPESILASDKDEIANALMAVHAFLEQLRFTLGGSEALPARFWDRNENDLGKVQRSLILLLHGNDDFAVRISSILYDPKYRLGSFGRFCALELVGSLKPEQVPPINGRMAKSLRFLGFAVRAT